MTSATVAVLGAAGGVGSVAAARLVEDRRVSRLVLVDARPDLAEVLRMDLEMLAATRSAPLEIEVGVPGARLDDLDVVACAAGVPHRDGEPRSSFGADNWTIQRGLLGALPAGWRGLVCIAANPVDVLATLSAGSLGPDAHVLGVADNDRLRHATAVAQVLGVAPHEVSLPVLGEHGGLLVPVWSRLTVRGEPCSLGQPDRDGVVAVVAGWYDTWQSWGTGLTTRATTGAQLASMVAQWLGPTSVRVASTAAGGRLGLGPASAHVALPVLLGERRVRIDLADDDLLLDELAADRSPTGAGRSAHDALVAAVASVADQATAAARA